MTASFLRAKVKQAANGTTKQPASSRVVSIDIFRGVVMALMILVNDLASVHGLSKWAYHMPTDVDAMSFADVVFPAFLFIVGMAMPFSIHERLRRKSSLVSLWQHIALRVLALLVLGLILANSSDGNAWRMHGLSPNLWTIAALAGGVLVWGTFGSAPAVSLRRMQRQRGVGIAMLVACFACYRRVGPEGHTAWIEFAYPEILGLIGMTYLSACLMYVPTRTIRWAPLAWLVLLLTFDAACMAHVISIAKLPIYVWPFDNGSMPAMVMAGVFANTLFFDRDLKLKPFARLLLGLASALLTALLGWLMVPFGISKNRGTPTWSLWSISACFVVFSLLYLLCDVRKKTRWALPFRSAGSNTLLTYLLPDIYVYAALQFGFMGLLLRWNHGWPGVLRALLFTCAMLTMSTALTRARIRMQI